MCDKCIAAVFCQRKQTKRFVLANIFFIQNYSKFHILCYNQQPNFFAIVRNIVARLKFSVYESIENCRSE